MIYNDNFINIIKKVSEQHGFVIQNSDLKNRKKAFAIIRKSKPNEYDPVKEKFNGSQTKQDKFNILKKQFNGLIIEEDPINKVWDVTSNKFANAYLVYHELSIEDATDLITQNKLVITDNPNLEVEAGIIVIHKNKKQTTNENLYCIKNKKDKYLTNNELTKLENQVKKIHKNMKDINNLTDFDEEDSTDINDLGLDDYTEEKEVNNDNLINTQKTTKNMQDNTIKKATNNTPIGMDEVKKYLDNKLETHKQKVTENIDETTYNFLGWIKELNNTVNELTKPKPKTIIFLVNEKDTSAHGILLKTINIWKVSDYNKLKIVTVKGNKHKNLKHIIKGLGKLKNKKIVLLSTKKYKYLNDDKTCKFLKKVNKNRELYLGLELHESVKIQGVGYIKDNIEELIKYVADHKYKDTQSDIEEDIW